MEATSITKKQDCPRNTLYIELRGWIRPPEESVLAASDRTHLESINPDGSTWGRQISDEREPGFNMGYAARGLLYPTLSVLPHNPVGL